MRVHVCPLLFAIITPAIVGLLIVEQPVSAQTTEIDSPDRQFLIKIVDEKMAKADPIMGDMTLVVSKGNHVIFRAPTTGYLIDALWNRDGNFVAINNRRGNSGDYVWIVSLLSGKALKKPDDGTFSVPLKTIAKECARCTEGSFDRDLMMAKAWRSVNEVEIETRWRFYETALVVRTATYKIDGRKFRLIKQRIVNHPPDWQPVD